MKFHLATLTLATGISLAASAAAQQSQPTYQTAWPGSFYGSHGTFLADMTGDGLADLIGFGDGYVGLIPATGAGFGAYQSWANQSMHGSVATLIGRADKDKKADLVTIVPGTRLSWNDSCGFSGSLAAWVTPSTGQGFGTPSRWYCGNLGASHGYLLGDLNGDGLSDLIGLTDSSVWVALNTGSSFGAPITWASTAFYGSVGTFVADADGDGYADLIGLGSNYVGVLRSTGSGFRAYETWQAAFAPGTQGNLVADVTGDRRADVITLSESGTRIFASDGQFFSAPWSATVNPPPWAFAFYGNHGNLSGDIDGDGIADLVGLGDGYVGALLAPSWSAFGYQKMARVRLPGTSMGCPHRSNAPRC